MRMREIVLTLCLVALLASHAATAQDGGRDRRGGRSRRGGFMRMSEEDREKFRNMSQEERTEWMMKRREEAMQKRETETLAELKEELKPADEEEWQILEMLLKKIMQLRMQAYSRGSGGSDRSRGDGNSLRDQERAARDALRELAKQTPPTVDGLKASMAKLRELRAQRQAEETRAREEAEKKRAQAQAELETARTELKSILTVQQEAVLLSRGFLE